MIISILQFGLTDFISTSSLFILMSSFSRFLQGLSAGAYETIAYSYVPLAWPKEIEYRYGILEISAGLGIGLGPMIGSFIYLIFGYTSIFIIQSFYILLIGLYVVKNQIPDERENENENKLEEMTNMNRDSALDQEMNDIKKINGKTEISIEGKEKIGQNMNQIVSILEIIKKRDILFLCLILCFGFTALALIMTDFENFILEKGGSVAFCSLLFFLYNVNYVVSVFILEKMRNQFSRITIFDISITVIAISLLFVGSDYFFHFDNPSTLFIFIGIGMLLLGFGMSYIILLFIPESIDLLANTNLNLEQKSDISCVLYTSFLSAAELIGPIVGGFLAENIGFSKGCFFYAIFILLFFFSYLKYGNGWEGIISIKFLKDKKAENRVNLLEMRKLSFS